MTTKTIATKFDRTTLPEWAQHKPAIIAYAMANLGFRCDVCRAEAESEEMRRRLTKQAEQWYYAE